MARRVPRFLDTNLAHLAATSILPSSQDVAFPGAKLKDPSLGATWRSLMGWTPLAGFRDKLDFKEAGNARVATITPGTYVTGAAYAAAVQSAMNAAPGHTNTYTVTYDVATLKYTITRATGTDAVELPFLTGANAANSAHVGLGYTSTDKTAGHPYVAENAAHQGEHYVLFDLGSAMAPTAGLVCFHNAGAGGTFTMYGKSTNQPWITPSQTLALTGDSYIRLAYAALTSQRYWAIVINDVQNPLGYAEVGIASPYTYRALVKYSPVFVKRVGGMSTKDAAVAGAHYYSRRQERRQWLMRFGPVLQDADRLVLEAVLAAVGLFGSFFLAFDATGDQANVRYVHIDEDLDESYNESGSLMVTIHLMESLP